MQWFTALSDTAQAGILAALIAIVGVIMNNVVSAKNASRQLEHDRTQKAAERALSLRRDIYLGVTEHIYDGFWVIAGLADVSTEYKDIIANWRKSAQYTAKLHVVAGTELLLAVDAANGEIQRVMLELRPERDAILADMANAAVYERQAQRHYESHEAALEMARDFKRRGNLTDKDATRLFALADEELKYSSNLRGRQLDMNLAIAIRRKELVIKTVRLTQEIYPTLVPCVAAVRKELGEAFDEDGYTLLLSRVKARLAGVEAQIERLYQAATSMKTASSTKAAGGSAAQ